MSAVLFVQSSDGTLTRASARAINAAVRAAQVNAPVLTGTTGFADVPTIEAWNALIAAGVEVAEATTATLAPAQKAAQTRRTNRRHARKAASTGYVRELIRARKAAQSV